MIWSLSALLACLALGDVLHSLTGLPVPGAVFGIGLLLAGLCLTTPRDQPASLPAADLLLPCLGLLFVPPGVAAVRRLSHLSGVWLPVAGAILVSSVLALVIAGRVTQALLARQEQRRANHAAAARLHYTPGTHPHHRSGAQVR